MKDPSRLDGRRALVTGANTGIGQAIAVALARAGAEVGCAARRDVRETTDRIAAQDGRSHPVPLDLSGPMAAGPVLKRGGYDILVNSAGITAARYIHGAVLNVGGGWLAR